MLTLLFIIEHFKMAGSGAENYAVSLCRTLADKGYGVHVLCRDGSDIDGLTVHRGLDQRQSIVDAVTPDLTIDWGLYHPADIHRLGGGIHESFLEHNLEAYRGVHRFIKRIGYGGSKHRRLIAEEQALIHAPGTHLLANSAFVRDHALAAGACPDQVTVLYNGVNTKHFKPGAPGRATTRNELGLAETDVVFLFVAHNLRLKNLDLLTRIMPTLTGQHQHAKLLIVGKRKPSKLPENSHFAGPQRNMDAVYRACDVLLHPTYFDACANVVLEAMASGLPVLVSDRCGVDALVDDTAGSVLPVTTENATAIWCDAITNLADNAERRQRLGQGARAIAEKHDFERYVKQFEHFLATIHQRKRASDST